MRRRSDEGFTLPELLVAITILGIIMVAIGAMITTSFRTSTMVSAELQGSRGPKVVSRYWVPDVEQAETVTPGGGGCGGRRVVRRGVRRRRSSRRRSRRIAATPHDHGYPRPITWCKVTERFADPARPARRATVPRRPHQRRRVGPDGHRRQSVGRAPAAPRATITVHGAGQEPAERRVHVQGHRRRRRSRRARHDPTTSAGARPARGQPRPRARHAGDLRAHRAGARPVRVDERRVGLRPQGQPLRSLRRRGGDAGRDQLGPGPAPGRPAGDQLPGHHDRQPERQRRHQRQPLGDRHLRRLRRQRPAAGNAEHAAVRVARARDGRAISRSRRRQRSGPQGAWWSNGSIATGGVGRRSTNRRLRRRGRNVSDRADRLASPLRLRRRGRA